MMRRAMFLMVGLLALCQYALGQDASAWKTFSSQTGRFSVRMPGTPTEEKAAKQPNDDSPLSHSFVLGYKDSAYFVTFTDFDTDKLTNLDADSVLKAGRDGGIKNVKGHLLSDHEITLDGYPGREVSASFPLDGKEGRAKFRIYLVKARLYMVLMVGPTAKVIRPETDVFLKSFRLLDSEPQDGWKTFASKEGQFDIRVPDLPKEDTSKLENGGIIHQYVVDKKDHAYLISYNLIAEGAPLQEAIPALLNKGRDAMLKSMTGMLVEEHDITLAGNPGKAIKFTIPSRNGIVLVRSYIVKDRYYQVMALGERKAMETAGADKYLASFHLTADSEASEWKPFTSKEGGFSIDMPGVPKEEKIDADTTKFRVDKQNRVYLIVYANLPQAVTDEDKITAVLEAARDEEVKAVHGTIISQKRITLGDTPGLEVKFSIKNDKLPDGGFGVERFYLVGKKLYEVAVITGQSKPDESSFARLFDSFTPAKSDNP